MEKQNITQMLEEIGEVCKSSGFEKVLYDKRIDVDEVFLIKQGFKGHENGKDCYDADGFQIFLSSLDCKRVVNTNIPFNEIYLVSFDSEKNLCNCEDSDYNSGIIYFVQKPDEFYFDNLNVCGHIFVNLKDSVKEIASKYDFKYNPKREVIERAKTFIIWNNSDKRVKEITGMKKKEIKELRSEMGL